MGKVKDYIEKSLKRGPLHFPLIDPDESKFSPEKLRRTAEALDKYGSDAVLVGGSTNIKTNFLDAAIKTIKKYFSSPVILFPGGLNGISRHADAILFMSLLNSSDPYWIVKAQSQGAIIIKKLGIEPIPIAYLIIEPGMEAGRVGKAEVIKRNEIEKAVKFALAAQYMGMSLVYLEAGSGAPSHVPPKMVKEVKDSVDIPVVVGGGIRSADATREILEAGADIIVTGTLLESEKNELEEIVHTIKQFR